MTRGEVRIGCSGWEYRHWRSAFYPREIPHARWLEFYAERFDTVELNGTFYRLPQASTFDAWRQRAPGGFRYAVKASRYLTHIRRLREPARALHRLWSRAEHLRDRLGPVLYQLPPRWHRNLERLETFLNAVPTDRSQAIEFRDPTWHHPNTYALLDQHGVALCLHDMPGTRAPQRPEHPVGPFVYVRFHGQAGTYAGAYPPQTLGAWARAIAGWADAGASVWAYFNNDVGGHAPRDAARLRDAVERHRSG